MLASKTSNSSTRIRCSHRERSRTEFTTRRLGRNNLAEKLLAVSRQPFRSHNCRSGQKLTTCIKLFMTRRVQDGSQGIAVQLPSFTRQGRRSMETSDSLKVQGAKRPGDYRRIASLIVATTSTASRPRTN